MVFAIASLIEQLSKVSKDQREGFLGAQYFQALQRMLP